MESILNARRSINNATDAGEATENANSERKCFLFYSFSLQTTNLCLACCIKSSSTPLVGTDVRTNLAYYYSYPYSHKIAAKPCEQPVCVVLEQKPDNSAEIMTDYHNVWVLARVLRPPEGDLVIYKQGCVYFPTDVLSNSDIDCNFVLLWPFYIR